MEIVAIRPRCFNWIKHELTGDQDGLEDWPGGGFKEEKMEEKVICKEEKGKAIERSFRMLREAIDRIELLMDRISGTPCAKSPIDESPRGTISLAELLVELPKQLGVASEDLDKVRSKIESMLF